MDILHLAAPCRNVPVTFALDVMAIAAFRFRSTNFRIDPTEDEQTNPFCYGRSLAEWLRVKLTWVGYTTEEVIPEDFGWIVVLSRGSGMLWVGCVNEHHHLYALVSPEAKPTFVPDAEPVTWEVWVAFDRPFWSLNFSKRRTRIAELEASSRKVAGEIQDLLRSESGIEMLEVR